MQHTKGGADIVDVKNPKEGSLGANFPWIISSVKESINSGKPISATIGDFNFKPGTASLAALGAAGRRCRFISRSVFMMSRPKNRHLKCSLTSQSQ